MYCDGRHCRIAVRTRTGAAVYAGSAKTVKLSPSLRFNEHVEGDGPTNAGQDVICVWHGSAGHFADRRASAHAACRSPKNICKHFDDCLQRTSDSNNKDADGIRAGVKARNGQIVLAGAEACARDLGRKQQWDKWARGCSELEFVQIAKVGLELGKVHCDRYSQ